MKWKVPLFKTYNDEEDVALVSSVIRRGTYWATGPEIQEFENHLATFIGRKYAVSFNSGTSALHALLEAYNIKGKEVIVPSFTFIATANAVVLAGGIPVFAEAEDITFGLDAEDVARRITKNTVAVMPIHYGGCVARDIEKIRDLCVQKGLLLIEDAAQSFGAAMNGIKAGCFGDAAMFSFCQNKVITTGEGGAIVTDSENLYEKLKLLRSHGRVEVAQDYFSHTGDNEYVEAGYNFRMPTISAALGISQFKKFSLL
ncbi:MAG: DegT/DnrJ/EryC1/StrS family aminotransferase, partial [Nanoarchaeota archaeon]